MSEPTLLNAAEVSALLRVSVQTVYRWAKSENGQPPVLPSLTIGGTVRWRREDVERLLAPASNEPSAVNE